MPTLSNEDGHMQGKAIVQTMVTLLTHTFLHLMAQVYAHSQL